MPPRSVKYLCPRLTARNINLRALAYLRRIYPIPTFLPGFLPTQSTHLAHPEDYSVEGGVEWIGSLYLGGS